MSEKRHQHQQRRPRRKAQGGNRSRAHADPLNGMLAELARLAAKSVREVADALDAEHWASDLIAMWRYETLPGEDADAAFPRLVRALEALGTAPALAALRALSAIGAPGTRVAADRLAAAGVREPAWADGLGRARPAAAILLEEPAFDDGVSVMVEFLEPGGESYTFGIYIDHNLGGLVKDVVLAGPLGEVREDLERAPDRVGVVIRELDLGEARARIQAALDMLDQTFDPPVSEDVRSLRALLEARVRLLPGGFELPDAYVEMTFADREQLHGDFLASPEGRRWRGDEDAEYVAWLAIDFGADYNHGGPLRWSPVVIELFMADWLARKITGDLAFFERVPEVLAGWVRYAGRRREVPAQRLNEALAAIEENRDEMLDNVGDPDAWGPAKAFATAALEAGVDLTDRDAVGRFIRVYNEELAA
jgi:hypothetical protein